MDKRAWIVFGVATVAILTGLIFFSRQEKVDVSKVDANQPITSQKSEQLQSGLADNIYGKKDSDIILIEYGDYSCQGCEQLEKRLRPILEEYKDDITFIYRHFPLTTIHPNARLASAYAEAAGLQGQYWQMHEKLFENRLAWWQLSTNERDGVLDGYAKELGLNIDQLKKDISDDRISQKINFDQELGKSKGVNSTPSLFLNGKEVAQSDFQDAESIRSLLDEAVKEKK